MTGSDEARVGAGGEIGWDLGAIQDCHLMTVTKTLPGACDPGETCSQNHNVHSFWDALTQRRDYSYFDRELWCREFGLDAGAGRCLTRRAPGIPHFIHLVESTHIREPDCC